MLAEPINLVTNLFFVAGGLMAMYLIMRLPPEPNRKRFDLSLLALTLIAIGIGSGLWHLMPSHETLLMDVIPITLFINLYMVSTMRRILRFSWSRLLLWWSVYAALTVAFQKGFSPELLNGTIMYAPTYLALVALTGAVATRSAYVGKVFLSMLLLWTASLAFRTIDMNVCSIVKSGTHYLWHTLNAVVLYRLLAVLIRYRPLVVVPSL